MTKSLYDPEYWKERAAKARLRAEESVGGSSYPSLLQQAREYDRRAEEVAQQGPVLPSYPIVQSDPDVASSEYADTPVKPRYRWPFLRLGRRS